MYLEWETKFPISGRASRAVGPLVMVRQLPSLRLRRQMRNWLSCMARVYSKSWTQKNLDPSGVRRLCLSFWLSDLARANSLINLWSSASMQALDEREWKKGWSLDQQQHEDSQDDSLPTLTTASGCLTEQLSMVSVSPILLASSLVWKEPPADWSDIINRPLFSNAGCIQNCLWQSCLHPHNSFEMWKIGMRHRTGSPWQVGFLLYWPRTSSYLELPGWDRSPSEKSLFILVVVEIRLDWWAQCWNDWYLLGRQSMDSSQSKWICDPLSCCFSFFF